MDTLTVGGARAVMDLDELSRDPELRRLGRACWAVQRAAALELLGAYRPSPRALEAVSVEALQRALGSPEPPSDIRTHPDLLNCIVFHTAGFETSVVRDEILAVRQELDQVIADRLSRLFPPQPAVEVAVSGHFLYPRGGYLGWHTNSRVPGWRLYLSYAEEPHRSFFRYLDPATREVVTSWDNGWGARLFEIDAARPLWHAVYSETVRFSVGYRVLPL